MAKPKKVVKKKVVKKVKKVPKKGNGDFSELSDGIKQTLRNFAVPLVALSPLVIAGLVHKASNALNKF